MRLVTLAGVALAVMAGASRASADLPRGYSIDSVEARSAPPLCRDDASKDYACSVQRTAPDSKASHLLAIAECVYPPRSLLAGLAAEKGYEIGSDTARVPLWWCRGTRERRIPYAATRGALKHYLALTERYRDREYREPGSQPILSSGLIYVATISRREDFALESRAFRDVYVASVALSWTYDDGTFLPFVSIRRTVVFNNEGEILAVDGDGQEVEDVAISANRGIGRQRKLQR